MPLHPGANIWSGANDPVCAALTNPTNLAVAKGKLQADLPVVDTNGKTWPNAETAYKAFRTGDLTKDIEIMARIIKQKLLQYPILMETIEERGGVAWLASCYHITGRIDRWIGYGEESAFIRALIKGYNLARKET